MTLQNCFSNDNTLRGVFTWLSRIGASPKFGSRPIGWYQMHQCEAIGELERVLKYRYDHCNHTLRCKRGTIQALHVGRWHDVITVFNLYSVADTNSRK